MCMLKAKLTKPAEMCAIYQRNLEFVDPVSDTYCLGQFSVHALWNMTGVLDLERDLFRENSVTTSHSPKKVGCFCFLRGKY